MQQHTTRNRVAIAVVSTTAAAAFGVAALAGNATASSVDDDFLATIAAEDIAFDSPAGAIADAHLVCDYLADGRTGSDIGAEIMDNSDLTAKQSSAFVIDAAFSYCPGHVDMVLA